MNKLGGFVAAGVLALPLAGCMHTVPALTPEFAKHGSKVTVSDIMDHIACEIVKSNRKELQNYLVTVLLTLQVDDTIDLTPSLGLTQTLPKPAVSLVTTVNADLGGARQRTFTTSYSFNVADLKIDGCVEPKFVAYSLEGNLRIEEIIDDGLNVTDKEKHKFVIAVPANANDKSGPSFGSKVQFIITQSVTNFGPVWTLKYFKGGGGSNGLFNGKRLDTDSVLITFAPKPPQAAPAGDPNKALEAAIEALAEAIGRQTLALEQRKRELADVQQRSREFSAHIQLPGVRGGPSKEALQALSAQLESQEQQKTADVKTAEDALANSRMIAQIAVATKQSVSAAVQTNTSQSAASAAANAAQQLQLNMLLQNLTIGH